MMANDTSTITSGKGSPIEDRALAYYWNTVWIPQQRAKREFPDRWAFQVEAAARLDAFGIHNGLRQCTVRVSLGKILGR